MMILRDFSNNNDDAADCQEGSASVRNAADITATDHEEVSRLRQELKKLLELTTSNLNTSTSRKRRLLETTQRQKPCRLETTPAHRHPARPLQESNLQVANTEELLARVHMQMAQLHPSHTKDKTLNNTENYVA